MKLRMLVGLSGNEYSLSPGDERDFPDAEAGRLIDAGYAEAVVTVKAKPAPEQEADADEPARKPRKKAD